MTDRCTCGSDDFAEFRRSLLGNQSRHEQVLTDMTARMEGFTVGLARVSEQSDHLEKHILRLDERLVDKVSKNSEDIASLAKGQKTVERAQAKLGDRIDAVNYKFWGALGSSIIAAAAALSKFFAGSGG